MFAANYAIDKLMTSMAGGVDLDINDTISIEQTPETTPTVIASPTFDDRDSDAADIPKPTPDNSIKEEKVTPSPITTENNNTPNVKSQKSQSPVTDGNKPTDKGYISDVSVDKAEKIKEDVTLKEKADVASIVMGELSVSDIKRLQELASGGLTDEEKNEARRIIFNNVSPDQYNELIQIAKKYGVSQGRSYDEVSGEVKGSEE